MADTQHSIPASAQQPGLRSFIVYRDLPEGCSSFEANDGQTEPHIHAGEFAVVDTSDREPNAGELFLCAFGKYASSEKVLRIMEVSHCPFVPGHFFLSEVQSRPVIGRGAPSQKVKFLDGPYPPEHLTETIFRGKVVGIYQPDFRRQLESV